MKIDNIDVSEIGDLRVTFTKAGFKLKEAAYNQVVSKLQDSRFNLGPRGQAIDCGGSGDCFFRCLHAIHRLYRDQGVSFMVLSIEDYYAALDLPMYTWIEDTHINNLAVNTFCTISVLSKVGDEDYISTFGTTGLRVYLQNVGNYHYKALVSPEILEEAIIVGSAGFDSTSQEKVMLMSRYIPEVEPETVDQDSDLEPYSDSEVEEISLSDESSEEEVERAELKFSVLPPGCSPETLFSYLRDFGSMSSGNELEVLDAFEILHHTVLDWIFYNSMHNAVSHPYVLKLYYKARHNTFGFLCTQNMGLRRLDTDASLSKYIDSKRTPDMIIETQTSIDLLEYTVSNKYEMVDFYKGGGLIDVKYTKEAELIAEKTGKKCKVNIVPAVLDEFNVEEIKEIMSPFTKINETLMSRYFSVCNKYKSTISNAYFSGLNSNTGISSVQGLFEIPALNSTEMLDGHFISLILKNWEWLTNFVIGLIDKRGPDYKIAFSYEKSDGRIRMVEQPKNMKTLRLSECHRILEQGDLSLVLNAMNYRLDGKAVSTREMRGDVAITVSGKKKESRRHLWNYSTTTREVYQRVSPLTPDAYGEFDTLPAVESEQEKVKVLFGEGYFSKLMNFNFSGLKSSDTPMLLANNTISDDYLVSAVNLYKEQYRTANNSVNAKMCPRQSFLLPMVTVPCTNTDLDNFNLSVISAYLTSGRGTYTKAILSKALDGRFYSEAIATDEIAAAKKEYSNARSAYTMKLIEQTSGNLQKWSAMAEGDRVVLSTPRSRMIRSQQAYISLLKRAKQKKVRTIKLNCGKNSVLKREFKNEMAHFSKENKGLKGVGSISNFETLNAFFNRLVGLMTTQGFHKLNLPPLYNTSRGPGPRFLTEDKDYYTHRWNSFYNDLYSGTMLEQLSVIGSNFSKLLFNESVKSYNQNYCRIDNLGFDQVVVIVRGGKKAYSRNMSKLFKVGFEVDPTMLQYMGYDENPSFEVIRDSGRTFVFTPWSQIHIDTIYDWFSMRERVFLNCYSNYTREGSPGSLSKMAIFPSVLSFHNRRKTESLLHNVRYLIVNPLGKYSNLMGIMQSFGTFNHTYLDAWLKECLAHRYLTFAKKIHQTASTKGHNLDSIIQQEGLCDLWFNEPFINSDQLTSFIYITYAMTKAPVNASLEQASNLKSILEDIQEYEDKHGDVKGMDDESLHFNIFDFDPNVLDDDFKYDPTFCQFLGYHMAGFLRNRSDPNEINALWDRVSKKGLSHIANSNGLRGFNSNNFYGKKGYEVVYDYIIEQLESGTAELDDLVQQYIDLDPESAHDMIKSQSIMSEDILLDKITFHIVHKIQRGGGREIFCMDLVTKAHQNPLEQFFKGLCRMVPNEFISISSSKRHSIIHTDFFERTPAPWIKSTLRWVLDCRRWAPHSVFQKYMHFVHGMSPILPKDFVEKFETFGTLMMEKRYITREHVYGTINNNVGFRDLKKLLTPSKEGGTYQATVKFSFVMGIFNYLSSLMHAATQLIASEVVMNNSLKSGTGLVIMDPKCHSDDSAITSYHENSDSFRGSVLIYDWLMKGSNHMLSIKKSQVNENLYMEFLSILYIYDRYIPVIPKFMSSIPFKPTDQGYSADVTFAITQAVEILIQGGTIEESFLILKLTEKHVQNIYNLIPNPNLPYNYLGNLDSHPLELLLGGASCEIYKFMKYKPLEFWAATGLLENMNLIDSTSPTDLSVKWDMGSRMSHRLRSKYVKYTESATKLGKRFPWTLSNCKLGNEFLNVLWFVNKLNDSKYYASLMHEPDSRRFTRAFGSFKYRTVLSSDGRLIDVSKLSALLSCVDIYSESIEHSRKEGLTDIFEFVCDDLGSFYQAIESGQWTEDCLPNGYKDKPIYFNFSLPQLSNIRIDANEYVSYVREPEAYKLLGKRTNPARQVAQIGDYCTSLGLDLSKYTDNQLYMIVNKILNAGEHNFRLIGPVPGSNKKVDTFTSLLSYLSHNSVRGLIRPVVSVSTSRVDWRRKIVSGKVPQVVMDTLELKGVIATAENFEIESEPIFKFDLNQKMIELIKDTPVSWRPLLHASISKHDLPLINEYYWLYWERDQVKSGRSWYGKGSVYVSLPEVLMRFTVNNGMITEIEAQTESSAMFNTTSNWFLGNMLRLGGMSLPLDLAQYQDPNSLVLGYNSKSGSYGIDYPNRFDMVFGKPIISREVSKSFMFINCDRENRGRYWHYSDGMKSYKIEFFVPAIDSPSIDIANYVDVQKVKPLLTNKKIRDFCFNLSVEMREEFTFKTQEVIDTIGFSTLYKVLYNNPEFVNAFRGEDVQDIFLESIMEWRSHNEKFDFPSISELESMAKRSDLPQMPGKIVRYLHQMGISTMSDQDFSNIVSNLYTRPESERVPFLLSVFPNLSRSEQKQSLVIAIRSDRIYSCVSLIGRDVFKILNPVLESMTNLVATGTCISPTLTSLSMRFDKLAPDAEYVFRLIQARIIINAYNCVEISSESDPLSGLLLSIISELIDDNLLESMEVSTANVSILNSIKWTVGKAVYIKFMSNLLDNLYISTFGPRNPIVKKTDLMRYEDVSLSPHKKYMLKLLSWRMPETITVTQKKKKQKERFKLKQVKRKPGSPVGFFKPLDDDDQDEFNDGYEWNPDIEEDLMREDVGQTKQNAFVYIPCGSWVGIQSCRGTAHTLYVATHVLSRELLQAHGNKSIYQKQSYTSLLDYINHYGYYIVKISESKKGSQIEDFVKIDYTDFFKQENKFPSPLIEVDGKEYSKLEVVKTPSLARNISNFDSYFRRISIENVEKEVIVMDKKEEIMKGVGAGVSSEYKKARTEIQKIIDDYHGKKDPKTKPKKTKVLNVSADSESKPILESLNMEDLKDKIEQLMQLSSQDLELPAYQRTAMLERNFNFKEPMKLLRDPGFIGEFNALFNNTWGKFERNELRMTSLSKRTKLKYARLQMKAMPPQMQSHYAKIYGVLVCLLNDVETCEIAAYESHDLCAAIDKLFDVQTEAEESADLMMYLQPSYGEVVKNPDLDKIFGRKLD